MVLAKIPAPDEILWPSVAERLGLSRRPRELDELGAVRHYTRLSKLNFSIDGQFYPLGSCTMKYNPKMNETAAALPGFRRLHPLADEKDAAGAIALMVELQKSLSAVTGFPAVSLQGAAGAQGELIGVLMIRKIISIDV